MKKSLILFSLLLITTTACNDSSNTNKKPTTPEEIIAFNIEQMRHGFKMNGSIKQERQQVAVTSEGYVNIGNPEYNYYNTNFVFNDINSYIVSDKDDNKYSIYLNNKLIELLAIYGDHESYSNFKTILDFNLRQGNKKLFKGWKVRNGMWTHKKVK